MGVILGLAGKRASGKTVLADMIIDLNVNFRKISFADALKEMYSKENGIVLSEFQDRKIKEKHRKGLIKLASEMREKNPYIFVNYVFDQIHDDDFIVIDDLRTIEELAGLLKRNGKPIKIQADNFVRIKRGWKYDYDIDSSYLETELADCCADTFRILGGTTVYNNENELTALKKEAWKILAEFC